MGQLVAVMLTLIPEVVPTIFNICVIVELIGGFLFDKVAKKIKLSRAPPHRREGHEKRLTAKHFFKEHFYGHVIREHAPRLFLWLFVTMVGTDIMMRNFNLAGILPQNRLLLFVTAALIGIIPESGPHLLFVMLYREGVIPLSVLLVNTISQDGHGLLPLLSYSVKDAIKVQIATTNVSLIAAIILFFAGF